jgi:hypothetical protein
MIGFIIEGLPQEGSTQHFYVNGCTDGCVITPPTDFNNDLKATSLSQLRDRAGLPHAR